MSEHHHEHTHDHHDHHHLAVRPAEVRLPPSTEGSVVMEVGGDVGALVVYTPDALAGLEIELALRGDDRQFVHTEVRERRLPDATIFAAVFPAVPAGEYTLLPVAALPALDVSVEGGSVAELTWA
jgi:hypothetical protein